MLDLNAIHLETAALSDDLQQCYADFVKLTRGVPPKDIKPQEDYYTLYATDPGILIDRYHQLEAECLKNLLRSNLDFEAALTLLTKLQSIGINKLKPYAELTSNAPETRMKRLMLEAAATEFVKTSEVLEARKYAIPIIKAALVNLGTELPVDGSEIRQQCKSLEPEIADSMSAPMHELRTNEVLTLICASMKGLLETNIDRINTEMGYAIYRDKLRQPLSREELSATLLQIDITLKQSSELLQQTAEYVGAVLNPIAGSSIPVDTQSIPSRD